jgi:hypothetical protein
MDAQQVTLIAAVIAALTSVANILLTSWTSRSLERTKIEYARKDEERKNLRLALAEFTRELAVATQRIEWLVWKAENNPTSLEQPDLDAYEIDMKVILPRLFTAQVVVAAHNQDVHDRLLELAQVVYKIDDDIAKANVVFRKSPADGIQELQAVGKVVWQFVRMLPKGLSMVAGSISAGASNGTKSSS